MKHAQDMSREELLTLPIYDDDRSAIDIEGASILLPPASVADNLPNTIDDDAGGKWRVSLIDNRWMRYRSIASENKSENHDEAAPYSGPAK